MPEKTTMDFGEASRLLRGKKVSPVELTEECLRRVAQLDPKLNAFITVTAESALAEARAAEREIGAGHWKGPLHGVPIALKDLVDTAGIRTTAGSALFKDRIPAQDAELVRRLKAAGAVFLGKTNLHEFAYGGSSAISHFGPVRNPWNTAVSAGGSSGGSAAAVAAGLCYAAIGTDTGGSIRQPAAYCGIVGFKPTYGRVSAAGVIPLSVTNDHVGPMTRTVRDAALMLQVLAGHDPNDATSLNAPVPDYVATIADKTSSLRLGILRDYFFAGIHPDIAAAVAEALTVLKKLTLSQRDCPPLGGDATYAPLLEPYTAVLRAEAYAYHQEHIAQTPDRYQPPTLKRLLAGADVTPAAFHDGVRRLHEFRGQTTSYFQSEGVDLLVTPATSIPPPALADLADPDTARPRELEMLRNARVFNALGLPTISVPCGFTQAGLPSGLQITGRHGAEAEVLRLAYAYEQATQWHQRHPRI